MDNSADIENAINAKEAWQRFLLVNMADVELAKDGIRKFFRKKTKEEMLTSMDELNDHALDWICDKIALPTEDYEICECVRTILSQRKA